MSTTHTLKPYDFDLPSENIALRPAQPRESARLLVVHSDGRLEDRHIRDLPDILSANDLLVTNITRVLPASLQCVRRARDANGRDVAVQVNLTEQSGDAHWLCLAKPARRLKVEDRLYFGETLTARIVKVLGGGQCVLEFDLSGDALFVALDMLGQMPIPPYIAKHRNSDAQDKRDYQSIFAQGQAKSVAAPTASLHFTSGLLETLAKKGVSRTEVCLHVGMGTFAPLTDENFKTESLHAEWRSLSAQAVDDITRAKEKGGRVIAVGSTAMRVLESCAENGGPIAQTGPTDIFIQPGYEFQICAGMLTNFHLPASSLFMLVCAFLGRDIMQNAYAHAIKTGYRFYSYGDACLLLP